MPTLNRNNSNWSAEERRKINENWEILEGIANSTANGNNGLKQEVDQLKISVTNNTAKSNQALQKSNQNEVSITSTLNVANSADARSRAALTTASNVDNKAESALSNSRATQTVANNALTTANEAERKADYTQSQLDSIVADGNSSAEVVQARNNNATLRERLDKENLAITERLKIDQAKLKYTPNTAEPLGIITPYGDNQLTHPKVIDMQQQNGGAWNGFRYWMAYTPLPYYNEPLENPCLVVSNDMVNWRLVDATRHNGIVDIPGSNDYNSDTHLVFRPDLNTLEVWYRGVNETNLTETIYRRTTTDGVTFTNREVLAGSNNGNILNFLSPAVIWDRERSLYRIWIVNRFQIQYYETPTAKNWQFIKNITVYYGETTAAWHLDVEKTDLGYEMLISTRAQAAGVKDSLFHAVFADIVTQPSADAVKVISPNVIGSWDDQAIYRSCFIKRDGIYYVWYAGYNTLRNYGVGLTISTLPNDITTLQGVNAAVDNKRINELILSNADQTSVRLRARAGTPEVFYKNAWVPLLARTISDFPLDAALASQIGTGLADYYKYIVDGNIVTLNLNLPFATSRTGNIAIGTLPVGTRPRNTQRIPCNLIAADNVTFYNGFLQVSFNGTVTIGTYSNTTQWSKVIANGNYFID